MGLLISDQAIVVAGWIAAASGLHIARGASLAAVDDPIAARLGKAAERGDLALLTAAALGDAADRAFCAAVTTTLEALLSEGLDLLEEAP